MDFFIESLKNSIEGAMLGIEEDEYAQPEILGGIKVR
jgi:hypothetical protein